MRGGPHRRAYPTGDFLPREAKLWWDEPQGRGSDRRRLIATTLERHLRVHHRAIRAARHGGPSNACVVVRWISMSTHGSCTDWCIYTNPATCHGDQLSQQFGHGYRERRKFRQFFIDSLKRVSAVYPDAKFRVGEGGVCCSCPHGPHVPQSSLPPSPARQSVNLWPGVATLPLLPMPPAKISINSMAFSEHRQQALQLFRFATNCLKSLVLTPPRSARSPWQVCQTHGARLPLERGKLFRQKRRNSPKSPAIGVANQGIRESPCISYKSYNYLCDS